MNYGEVLTKAAKIIWKFKVLWIFGILASCGQGGGNSSGSSNYSSDASDFNSTNMPPELMRLAVQLERFVYWIEDNMWVIAVFVAVLCVLWIVAIFLSTIGRIGLVKGTLKADEGAESMTFGELWGESLPYFWRSFAINLIVGLPVFLIVISTMLVLVAGLLVAGPTMNEDVVGGMVAVWVGLFCLCMCLLLPAIWALALLGLQAQSALVIEELGVAAAFQRGWDVLRKNVGPVLIMFVILAVIGFVAGIVMILVAMPFLLPLVLPLANWFMNNGELNMTLLYLGLACCALYIPVSWLLQGILTAYTQSAWTLTFLRLTRREKPAPADALLIPDTQPMDGGNDLPDNSADG